MVALYPHQKEALEQLENGNILCGGVGSGKSRTSLAFYFKKFPGKQPDLYIITTAKKRDKKEWEEEASVFHMSEEKLHVDSWNNIKKYESVKDCFFIFDEQRVVGSGAWVKAFLRITKANGWILLSATPGDVWSDYIPVFIANGFYRNRSDFLRQHAVFSRWSKFPKIEKYISTGTLMRHRNDILVTMDFERKTHENHLQVIADYPESDYRMATRSRWNPFSQKPMVNAAELCYVWRKIVNSDLSRAEKVKDILKEKHRAIIFYNFTYELDILKSIDFGKDTKIAEWNGQRHEEVPEGERWVYLVQYAAGAEGWNCITTDTIIFYSLNYSYKMTHQAAGRINRLNTPYKELYYYHIYSKAPIDMAINRALKAKKKFNEAGFAKW